MRNATRSRSHHQDLIRQENGFVDVVSDEKRCCANTRQHVQQEVLHLAAGQGVERTEWFIEQQDPWLDHQSSGYRDPLLHAAGQLIGRDVSRSPAAR